MFLSGLFSPAFGENDIKKIEQETGDTVTSGGLFFRTKQVAGPQKFGGDMLLYGLSAMTGKTGKCKLGMTVSRGVLNGNFMKFELKMGGLTVEDAFMKDNRLNWRMTMGGGGFSLQSSTSSHVFNDGVFAYLEPMLFGIIHMNRHFRLSLGGGYTFTNTQGVRIEGPFVQAELFVGRY